MPATRHHTTTHHAHRAKPGPRHGAKPHGHPAAHKHKVKATTHTKHKPHVGAKHHGRKHKLR